MAADQLLKTLKNQKGFSLLEILLVLALIAALAVVILPLLRFTVPALSTASRDVVQAVSFAYIDATAHGQIRRLVFDLQNRTMHLEAAPAEQLGRPTAFGESHKTDFSNDLLKTDDRLRLLSQFNDKAKEQQRPMSFQLSIESDSFYSLRSIAVANRMILKNSSWFPVPMDSEGRMQKTLSSSVVFVSVKNNLGFSTQTSPDQIAYIYFSPEGSMTPTTIILGLKSRKFNKQGHDLDKLETITFNGLTGLAHLSSTGAEAL